MKWKDQAIILLFVIWVFFVLTVHIIMSDKPSKTAPVSTPATPAAAQESQKDHIIFPDEENPGFQKLLDTSFEDPLFDASTLFSGSMKNIRIILEAEQKFWEENGHYTENPADLKLSFLDVEQTQQLPGQTRIYLKNGYYYVFTKELVAVYYTNPKQLENWYHLDFLFNGKVRCVAKREEALGSCDKLGGTNPTQNARIPTWTMYDLPSDFLTRQNG